MKVKTVKTAICSHLHFHIKLFDVYKKQNYAALQILSLLLFAATYIFIKNSLVFKKNYAAFQISLLYCFNMIKSVWYYHSLLFNNKIIINTSFFLVSEQAPIL